MEVTETVKRLDDEVKVLKNEIQAVLLDIREAYLNRENPFNPEVSAPTISSVVAASMMGGQIGSGQSTNKKDKPSEEVEKEKDENAPSSRTSKKDTPESKDTKQPEEEAMTTKEEKAQEGVKQGAWGSEIKPASPDVSPNGHNGHNGSNGKIDLSIIAEMTQWVNEAVKKLGYDKTEAILDVAEIVGHLKPELKAILVKFAKRVPAAEISGTPSTHDFIGLLVKLEGLLGMNSKSDEIGLLSIFCQEV